MIKGAIFDIDGTLIDSMFIWNDLGVKYIKSLGKIPENNLGYELSLRNIDDGSEYIRDTYARNFEVSVVKQGILDLVRDFYYHEVKLKPGVLGFLTALADRGIKMTLATGGERELAEAALRRLGVLDIFDGLFTCNELKTAKNLPLIYNTAAAHIGCKPSETLVFEDVLHALQTANEAGFVTVGVADDTSASDREKIIENSAYFLDEFKNADGFLNSLLAK